ncbi:MAG: hypothetical protein C4532_11840 [Candidatus Abyssobacteria bacterium SURF_17]|uniref:Integrase catalytic domain-containing protein n=1 Tax=Candidatus Abyssobacteria bacterium SURF_17 TaxID=2093361 RepID=A0A419EWJ2_9BACT|nr:MAG: hypothetical protein C4532_11840 [Candidatus Abyssubacteria bacterium SURF_17]
MRKPKLTREQKIKLACEFSEMDGQASELVKEYCRFHQVRQQTVYRWIREGGGSTGHKQRSDKGTRKSSVPHQEIERAAILKYKSTTNKYISPMPAEVAIDVTGGANSGVKPHHVTGLLRKMRLDRKSVLTPTPHIHRRSERPNDEHQFDTSVCRIWYLDKKTRVRENLQAGRDKNKEAPRSPLIRYVVVDHLTHTFFFQYQIQRESGTSSAKFLHQAWIPKPDPDHFPFKGVPKRLYIDQGPTFKSQNFKLLCANLGIELIGKQPTGTRSKAGKMGNPRALGSVEAANWIIERGFESRFTVQKPENLEELNQWAYRWAIWYNYSKPHWRFGVPRFQVWMSIRTDELRIPPSDLDVFMTFAENWVKCKIYPDFRIRFKGERYSLESIPVDMRNTTAEVSYSPYRFPELRVRGADGNLYTAQRLAKLGDTGYYSDSVLTGSFRAFKDTETERSQKYVENYELGELNAFPFFSERLENVRYMPKKGKEIGVDTNPVNVPMLRALEVIKDALQRTIRPEENEALRAKYGEWIRVDEIPQEIERMRAAEHIRQVRDSASSPPLSA